MAPVPLKYRAAFMTALPILFIATAFPLVYKPLGPKETCGKKIYLQGVNCRGKEIRGLLGDMEVAGKAEACVNCHGPGGKGRPENGQDPGNITWEHLSLSYGHSHQSGRTHPAFTEGSFDQAVLKGVDPAQHPLSTLMPRFSMANQDLEELRSYLAKISTDFDPGVENDNLEIASILPLHGPNAEAGQAVRAVLNGYFEEINERGGIYNRRISLHIADTSDGAANPRHGLDPPVFALVAPLILGTGPRIYSSAPWDDLPVIGPLDLLAPGGISAGNVFYLSPGLPQLEAELVRFAIEQKGAQAGRSLVLWGDKQGNLRSEMFQVVQSIWKDHGSESPSQAGHEQSGFGSGRLERELQDKEVDSVFFMGTGVEMLEWMKSSVSHNTGWRPQVFVLGPLVKDEVFDAPSQFQSKIYAAYPAIDMQPAAIAEFNLFASRRHLAREHRLLQISAYCAARIFEEALMSAGRELDREKFTHSLEQIHDFTTGLLPPVSFGPNRRIGSTKIDVLCVDLQQRTVRRECR